MSAGALCATTALAGPPPATGERSLNMRCLDYGLSFVCNPASHNAVRFWLESRTTLMDDRNGTTTDFYQCASCKSENTFAAKNLFQANNYDFLPILSGGHWLTFRRTARLNPNYREIRKVEAAWGVPILKLREAPEVTVLDTWEKIRDATAAALPLVTQTEIANPETGLRAVIECPTKTMNVSLDKRLYQVDTGPIVFPDLTKRYDPPLACLSLAFIAFNAPHFADFVVEQPTPVVEDGKEVCKIHHYSAPFSLPAKNVVLALGKL
ncbi:MAG: hypothetical protein FJ388_24035 [Verrucomicrobia bacterium]|nr:hypothetical protein [Verrucomicrobiota bacterium]